VDKAGVDVTESFTAGAIAAFAKLEAAHVTKVVLKERSRSCGTLVIYDGSFTGTRIPGCAVAVADFESLLFRKFEIRPRRQLSFRVTGEVILFAKSRPSRSECSARLARRDRTNGYINFSIKEPFQ
jgi:hypothetical protein